LEGLKKIKYAYKTHTGVMSLFCKLGSNCVKIAPYSNYWKKTLKFSRLRDFDKNSRKDMFFLRNRNVFSRNDLFFSRNKIGFLQNAPFFSRNPGTLDSNASDKTRFFT